MEQALKNLEQCCSFIARYFIICHGKKWAIRFPYHPKRRQNVTLNTFPLYIRNITFKNLVFFNICWCGLKYSGVKRKGRELLRKLRLKLLCFISVLIILKGKCCWNSNITKGRAISQKNGSTKIFVEVKVACCYVYSAVSNHKWAITIYRKKYNRM